MAARALRILISGASVSGPIVAYWLRRFGFQTTVVERTENLRLGVGGHAVDLFGPAIEVMDWMNLGTAVRDARTRTKTISLVRPGKRTVEASMDLLTQGVSHDHVEIMRGDLARIVYEASRNDVEYILGDSIASLTDGGDHVEVTFEREAGRSFDLVVGADGLHSLTRRLIFGEEDQFLHFLGGYFAVFSVPNYLGLQEHMLSYAEPGQTVAAYPVWGTDQLRVLLLFRTPTELDYDRHDPAAQVRMIRKLYSGAGWEVPRLLEELENADDFYLDSISQIRMDTWTKGRVTLVGDAAYSPGPAVGGGTSLAVLGAYALAAELATAPDVAAGLAASEDAIRSAVQASRNIGPTILNMMIPRSRAQIWAMAQAIRTVPRLPAPVRRRITSFAGGPAAMLEGARLRDPASVP
jgi:2-polyprenyl-6-methoxyphenol hydroxylase-like FAD-dependent oxidoreductase